MNEIDRIIISGGPDPMTADEGEAGGVRYEREINETVQQFRDRAAADAEARGCVSIIFGTDDDEDFE